MKLQESDICIINAKQIALHMKEVKFSDCESLKHVVHFQNILCLSAMTASETNLAVSHADTWEHVPQQHAIFTGYPSSKR